MSWLSLRAYTPFGTPFSMMRPSAFVLIMTSDPALIASRARNLSNMSRSTTNPVSFPACAASRVRYCSFGANTRAPSTSLATHSLLGWTPISLSQAVAIPSPHRTGVPISWRFSRRSVFSPAAAAARAAHEPPGPAPTTMHSYFSLSKRTPPPSGPRRRLDLRFHPLGPRDRRDRADGAHAVAHPAVHALLVEHDVHVKKRDRVEGAGA